MGIAYQVLLLWKVFHEIQVKCSSEGCYTHSRIWIFLNDTSVINVCVFDFAFQFVSCVSVDKLTELSTVVN